MEGSKLKKIKDKTNNSKLKESIIKKIDILKRKKTVLK